MMCTNCRGFYAKHAEVEFGYAFTSGVGLADFADTGLELCPSCFKILYKINPSIFINLAELIYDEKQLIGSLHTLTDDEENNLNAVLTRLEKSFAALTTLHTKKHNEIVKFHSFLKSNLIYSLPWVLLRTAELIKARHTGKVSKALLYRLSWRGKAEINRKLGSTQLEYTKPENLEEVLSLIN